VAYAYDAYKRVVSVKRFKEDGQPDPCQCASYYYDRNPFDASFSGNAGGRLAAVQWGDASVLPGLMTEMYRYTPSGRIAAKRIDLTRGGRTATLDLNYGYDAEGRVSTVVYPHRGPVLHYGYDSMGRQNLLACGEDILVKDVAYSAAGHLSSLKQLVPETGDYVEERRAYDDKCHLRRIVAAQFSNEQKGGRKPLIDLEYSYNSGDGRVSGEVDRLAGEETVYNYDVSGRLQSSGSRSRRWGIDYRYDGFGNLIGWSEQGVSDRTVQAISDPATNRLVLHDVDYDNNGNTIKLPGMKLDYDIENRLVRLERSDGRCERYAYDQSNRRIWRQAPGGEEELFFYGSEGKLLAKYELVDMPGEQPDFRLADYQIHFADRLLRSGDESLVLDRLGSVRARAGRMKGNRRTTFRPFGGLPQADRLNRPMFGSFYRDEISELDYAEQRYYSSALGRFITPDPYEGSVRLDEPESWNRYAYADNDPVNNVDPHGACPNRTPWCTNYNCPAYNGVWLYGGMIDYSGYCAYNHIYYEPHMVVAVTAQAPPTQQQETLQAVSAYAAGAGDLTLQAATAGITIGSVVSAPFDPRSWITIMLYIAGMMSD
ncbi:MAG TPA: RHS repeat-associated core domain-containing protein, partial [Acidobacteriota bacterium]|nr:RHS repeat-associated core domain-containing protein [Acidobacteriota bacterium]